MALTLNGLSAFLTPDLARDLATDLVAMLNHSRAQIRKRAVLGTFKILEQYPEAGLHAHPRLFEKLDDPDPGRSGFWTALSWSSVLSGVVSATVNVLCELARRRPGDYLTLAPQLFHLLTNSTNNWMLIKIVKLVSSCRTTSACFNSTLVRISFSLRTEALEEITATYHRTHFNYACDLFAV